MRNEKTNRFPMATVERIMYLTFHATQYQRLRANYPGCCCGFGESETAHGSVGIVVVG